MKPELLPHNALSKPPTPAMLSHDAKLVQTISGEEKGRKRDRSRANRGYNSRAAGKRNQTPDTNAFCQTKSALWTQRVAVFILKADIHMILKKSSA